MGTIQNIISPNWTIIIEDAEYSASTTSFEPGSSTGMIPYKVPRTDLPNVPAYFTGYSYRSDPPPSLFGPTLLKRVLPQPHPYWPGMWGNRVQDIRGLVAWNSASVVKSKEIGPYDSYDEYRVDVYYGRRPYDVRQDGEVTKETQRYVEKKPGKPYTSNISIEGGQLQFLTKGTIPIADGPVIQGPNAARRPLLDVEWTWYEVPLPWIMDKNFRAINLELQQGTVNDADWEGFPAGTLYLDSVNINYEYATVSTAFLGLANYKPPRYAVVEFKFKFFQFGWQNVPYPGTGEWSLVAWKDNPTQLLYETSDFDQLFAPVPLI